MSEIVQQPCQTKTQAPISDLVMESFQSQGLPLYPDMFSSGESPHGCGHVPRTVYKGDRTTAANYLANKGPNLSVKTDTIVDKIILEGEESELRATGVKIIEKDGKTRDLKAKKEVIVSGGAYCSPTILLRSGIGEKAQLLAHGIDCKVDLLGVGKNLMDHLVSLSLFPGFHNLIRTTDRVHLLLSHEIKHYKRPPSLQTQRTR